MADAVLERFRVVLAETEPLARRAALRTLVNEVQRGGASPAFIALLARELRDESDPGRRSAAMELLAAVGEPAIATLDVALDDERAGVRRLVVDALALMRHAGAFSTLERASRDVDAAVRAAALEGLGGLGGEPVVAVLQRVLQDAGEHPAVVMTALLGVEQLGVDLPVHALRAHLAQPMTTHVALRLLGRAGDIPTLVEHLCSPAASRRRAATIGLSTALQRPDAEAPAELAHEHVREALREIVREGDSAEVAAAALVAACGGDVEALYVLLRRDDRARHAVVGHRAARLLLPDRPDLAARLDALSNAEPVVRDVAREIADGVRSEPVAPTAVSPHTAEPRTSTKGASPAPRMTPADLRRLAQILERTAGHAIADEAHARLEARLIGRVIEHGGDVARYLELLEEAGPTAEAERQLAIEAVAIHETYFFRELPMLEGFRDELLPELAVRRRGEPLRIWSAACSTGEEVWTLAMILALSPDVADFEILGTDVSRAALATAEAGRYPRRAFRHGVTAEARPFLVERDGHFEVSDDLRRRARFAQLNLVDVEAIGGIGPFDAVFCRNVLIYLTPSSRARAMFAVHERLVPGGALILGHSESLLHIEIPFAIWPMRRGIAYRREQE